MKWQVNGEQWGKLWKKYRFALLILLFGLLLLLWPSADETGAELPTEEREVFSLAETEARMERILSRIQGVGQLELMLTLKSGSQLELAQDSDVDETRQEQQTVTLHRGSGYEDVVVTRRFYPVYQGALVVCRGADSPSVRLAVTEAVAALTGLSSDCITVVKWNS